MRLLFRLLRRSKKKHHSSGSTPLAAILSLRTLSQLPTAELVRAFVRDAAELAAPAVEASASSLRTANEDTCTDLLLANLNAAYFVTRESDSRGHVDISLHNPIASVTVVLKGEAKVIDQARSFAWYGKGLEKLVGKYSTGREGVAVMVCYYRRPNMYVALPDYQAQIATDHVAGFLAHVDADVYGLRTKAAFVTKHSASGAPLDVVHIWINLFSPLDVNIQSAFGGSS